MNTLQHISLLFPGLYKAGKDTNKKARHTLDADTGQSPSCSLLIILSHEDNAWDFSGVVQLINTLQSLYGLGITRHITVLSAQNNPATLQSHISQHLDRGQDTYDIVITFGIWVTDAVRQFLGNSDRTTPRHFYICRTHSHTCQTLWGHAGMYGIHSSAPNYQYLLDTLQLFYPEVTTILIPYAATHKIQGTHLTPHDLTEPFAHACTQAGLQTDYIQIHENTPLLVPQMDKRTAIVVLPEVGMEPYAQELAKVCNEEGITLFSADLTVVSAGAAFGCGSTSSPCTTQLAHALYQHLEGTPLFQLECRDIVEPGTVYFNQHTLHSQGSPLSQKTKLLLNMRPLYGE